ncbi:hypothetical protein ANN_20329 [Periplaneta americana]|uniref:Uncharacterized protein n=1 Tax=Periplaneta americana TaxID=6978 RepID=A0ABQ8SCB5_PERAM|nr:hypothetical protein ANN_20329 [Periplaneta americana]
MDFETSGKGGNPFLMEDLTDYNTANDATSGGGLNSNPFLSNSDFNIPAASENPFLNAMGATEPTSFVSSGNSSTNPFAQFDYSDGGGMDTTTTIDFFSAPEPSETNIFAANDTTHTTSAADDFFSGIPVSQPQTESRVAEGFDLLNDTTPVPSAEADFCKETSDIFNSEPIPATEDSSRTSTPKGGPPRRPPPPRPVPPSKETKDLILSVTGAMEATSSHLLDRLQATRTPSPTPIRDLHSPSPTPDIPFSDLLGADVTSSSRLPAFPSNTELNLLGEEPEPSAPSAPAPPPRPAPPAQKTAEPEQDIMDIFSGDAPAPTTVAPPQTNSDILGLFDSTVPVTQGGDMSGTADFLLGDDFGGVPQSEPQEMNLMTATAMDLEPVQQPQADSFMATDMLEATEAPVVKSSDEFDAFAAKFESAAKDEAQEVRVVEGDPFDPFASSGPVADTGDDGK